MLLCDSDFPAFLQLLFSKINLAVKELLRQQYIVNNIFRLQRERRGEYLPKEKEYPCGGILLQAHLQILLSLLSDPQVGMDDHWANFFYNMHSAQLSTSEVFDGIVQRKSILIKACFNTIINHIDNLSVRLYIDMRDRYALFKPKNFLSVKEADEKLKHIWPHHIGNVSHQLSNLMGHIGAKILFDHLN